METIREAICNTLAAENPMTVRQVFYRLVGESVVEKTEAQYDGTVIRLLRDMRIAGRIPFDWITDNTRWMRKPNTFSSLESALKRTAEAYRRSVWDSQPAYVEVWCEKDAVAGILYEETARWDVPLMVAKGHSSITYLHAAAEYIALQGKPAFIYYFGDYDKWGVDISRGTERRLHEFAPHSEIHFARMAVNEDQIAAWNLPTRPSKKGGQGFSKESVEVDAVPPDKLRALVRQCIERHIDHSTLDVLQVAEASERDYLRRLVAMTQGRESAEVAA